MTNSPSAPSTHTSVVPDPSQLARDQIRIEPVPDWVRTSTANLNYQAKRRGAVTYLLIERQIHAELNQTFVRVAMRLETMEAVQHQSQWQLPFEPATQSVKIHSIVIRRSDTSFDHTRLDKMRWLQREEGLERFVIDGWFTLLLLLDDVRQGDILEWSYTIIARPRLLPEYCYHLFPLPFGLDIGSFNFAVRRNSSRPLRWKSGHLDVKPVEAALGDELVWTWSGNDFSTPDPELNTPEWHVGFAWVQVSDCPDWATVARAVAKAWADQTACEAEILATAHDIEANEPTLLARAAKAIELLQDDFRYLSVSLNFGGQIPTPPHVVLQRRYGDCKDLSLLLTELLNALGIPARPVLVAADWRKVVADMLPMPNLFNHVIVEFVLGGKTVWVDATMKRQGGGALNRVIENFGAGLPVDSTAPGIVAAPRGAAQSLYEIKETILLDTTGKASLLGVKIRATGRFADALRNQIAVTPIDKVEIERLQECKTRFIGLTRSEPLQHQDDRPSNQFFLAGEFAIDGLLVPHPDSGFCTFHAPTSAIFSVVQLPPTEARRAPFALPHPCEIVHTLEIESSTVQPMAVAIPRDHKETAFIRFSRREKSVWGTWSMTLSLTTLADSVPAPSLQEHRQALDEIWRQSGSSLSFPTGYPHPRKRSNFGKLFQSAPLPARVVVTPAEPSHSISFPRFS